MLVTKGNKKYKFQANSNISLQLRELPIIIYEGTGIEEIVKYQNSLDRKSQWIKSSESINKIRNYWRRDQSNQRFGEFKREILKIRIILM